MNFKEKIQAKIEKNTIESTLSWTDKKGISKTEKVLLKRSRLPLVGDWGRIYPPLNENGSINWINLIFGGRKNFVRLLLILAVVVMVFVAFGEVFNSFEAFRSQPCVQACINKIQLPPQYLNLP